MLAQMLPACSIFPTGSGVDLALADRRLEQVEQWPLQFGLSSCLLSGFIAPLEVDVEGHATGAGRGAYNTSFSFMAAARPGVPMLGDPEKANCLRAVLLVAIPGHAGKGGLWKWTTDSSSPKGQR